MEVLLDQTLITYLYENSEYMSRRVDLFEQKRQEYALKDKNQSKVYPKINHSRLIWKWMDTKIKAAVERVKNDYNLYNTQDYVYETHKQSQDICAFRDAWHLKEKMSEGEFLLSDTRHSKLANSIEMLDSIVMLEDSSFSINTPDVSCLSKQD